MNYILPIIFFIALAIQIIYILFVFTKLIGHQDYEATDEGKNSPGVTIIVAAFNELNNLKELIPLLISQDYPVFEIMIADDRSSDGTYDYLLEQVKHIKNLNFLRIMDLPQHFTAKKYALTMAIKKSKYDLLLFTDADCRPNTDQWIKTMVSQLATDKDIVTGFSPYQSSKSALNNLIKYETFQTALQYMSFALAKMPFMGVGRNLMYRKSTFWKTNGFASHHGFLSGDDDLFVNGAATKDNVAISTNTDSYMISEPKTTWKDWYIQKTRHLSVGKKYKTKDRLTLGFLWISQLLVWFLAIPAFFCGSSWFEAPEWSIIPNDFLLQYNLKHWYPLTNWMRLILGLFAFWMILKWFILAKVNNKLGKTISNWKIPYHEFLYTAYLTIMGIITLFTSPKKIKWR